jgi:hypothetical protein
MNLPEVERAADIEFFVGNASVGSEGVFLVRHGLPELVFPTKQQVWGLAWHEDRLVVLTSNELLQFHEGQVSRLGQIGVSPYATHGLTNGPGGRLYALYRDRIHDMDIATGKNSPWMNVSRYCQSPMGLCFSSEESLYFSQGNHVPASLWRMSAIGQVKTVYTANDHSIIGLEMDRAGRVYYADFRAGIRRFDPRSGRSDVFWDGSTRIDRAWLTCIAWKY